MGKVKKMVEVGHDIKRAFKKTKEYLKKKLTGIGRSDLAREIESELDSIEEEEIAVSLTRPKTRREKEVEKNVK